MISYAARKQLARKLIEERGVYLSEAIRYVSLSTSTMFKSLKKVQQFNEPFSSELTKTGNALTEEYRGDLECPSLLISLQRNVQKKVLASGVLKYLCCILDLSNGTTA